LAKQRLPLAFNGLKVGTHAGFRDVTTGVT
jgi:hypothetical protein